MGHNWFKNMYVSHSDGVPCISLLTVALLSFLVYRKRKAKDEADSGPSTAKKPKAGMTKEEKALKVWSFYTSKDGRVDCSHSYRGDTRFQYLMK